MLKLNVVMLLYKIKIYAENLLKNNKNLYEIFVINKNKKMRDKERQQVLAKEIELLMAKKPFPLPSTIEIETQNRCNGECDFCPVNRRIDPREYKIMSTELFYSIVEQLKELNYTGYVSAYSNNEPLMDKRIFEFVQHIRQELPNAKTFLFTNGILITLDKFLNLIENLDYMIIDNYYEGERVLSEPINEIAKYCLEHTELKSKVKIQVIDKHMLRNSRAGNAQNRKHIYRLQSSCLWPFSQMVIRPDGKLSLCCNDALGQMTMGDLTKEKIIDIWNGEKYQKIRKSLLTTRQNIKICRECDSFGLKNRNDILLNYKIGQNWDKIKELVK